MKLLSALAAVIAASVIVIGPAEAQRAAAPQNRAEAQASAPAAQAPAPSERMTEAIRHREEASIDLEQLLTQVAASTGMEFLVDPRVRARVYGVPQIENPTYADLLSILRLHGYMAVEIEGRVNIVPDAFARHMPVRLLQRDDENVPDDEWVTRIISVPADENGVGAAQLVPLLRPLMPQAAHLAATVDSKLVLVDTYANVRRMTELINTLTR